MQIIYHNIPFTTTYMTHLIVFEYFSTQGIRLAYILRLYHNVILIEEIPGGTAAH